MEKTYFVSYWSENFKNVFNINISLYLKENIECSQGEIAQLISEQLNSTSYLINFWEI